MEVGGAALLNAWTSHVFVAAKGNQFKVGFLVSIGLRFGYASWIILLSLVRTGWTACDISRAAFSSCVS